MENIKNKISTMYKSGLFGINIINIIDIKSMEGDLINKLQYLNTNMNNIIVGDEIGNNKYIHECTYRSNEYDNSKDVNTLFTYYLYEAR